MYKRTRISHEERESAKRQHASGTVQTEPAWEALSVSFDPRVQDPTAVLQMHQKFGNADVQRMLAKYRPRCAPAPVIRREDEHVKHFKTYEGTTTHQYNETGADENDIDDILHKKFLTPNMDPRSAATDTLSGNVALSNFKADLSACDSPNKKV